MLFKLVGENWLHIIPERKERKHLINLLNEPKSFFLYKQNQSMNICFSLCLFMFVDDKSLKLEYNCDLINRDDLLN